MKGLEIKLNLREGESEWVKCQKEKETHVEWFHLWNDEEQEVAVSNVVDCKSAAFKWH